MTLRSLLRHALAGLALFHPLHAGADEPKASDKFAVWEKEIAAMEAADAKSPPPKGEIVFIGSSTIRMWKSLAQDFPDHKVINRGFGGSQIVDATHFLPRIVFPVEPRVIFLRSGGNDIHAGKSPEQVFADYKEFVAAVHAKLPETEIVYIGLAPTIARITEVEKGDKLCALVKDFAATNGKLKFIDTADMTPGPDGKPRADLFIADGLHFNDAGYKILAERVRPFLPPARKGQSRYQSGEEQFFAGRIKASLAEWDAQVAEDPSSLPGHWQRGLALYYAERYKDGRAQFEEHQKVNSEDVENAAWHFLCVAKSENVEAARKAFIPITHDSRVPMKEIHALFAGKGTPEDVLKAAESSDGVSARALRQHQCYAHLYLGLYFEALAKNDAAKAHMLKAAELHDAAGYMGKVAVVHCMVRGWK